MISEFAFDRLDHYNVIRTHIKDCTVQQKKIKWSETDNYVSAMFVKLKVVDIL